LERLEWNELRPRLSVLEPHVKGRSVLEVGTADVRSLLWMHQAGATRVTGCCPDPEAIDIGGRLPRTVELVAMDGGRLDFADGRFDAVVVPDLVDQWLQNPRFLDELHRIVAPDGLVLLAFAVNGPSWTRLADGEGPLARVAPEQLEAQVEARFPSVRAYLQTPFAAVSVHPEREDPFAHGVSLEPQTDRCSPSHRVLLAGRRLPSPSSEVSLVEVPFHEVWGRSEAERTRSRRELRRITEALGRAQRSLESKDASLREIQRRLPRLTQAVRARLAEGSDLPVPTVIDRPERLTGLPEPEGVPSTSVPEVDPELEALRAEQAELRSDVESEREARTAVERRLSESESAQREVETRNRELESHVEALGEELARLREAGNRGEAERQRLAEALRDAQARLRSAQSEWEASSRAWFDERETWSRKLEESARKLQRAEELRARLDAENAQLQASLEEARDASQGQAVQEVRRQAQADARQLERELQALRDENRALGQALDQTRAEQAAERAESHAAKQRVRQLDADRRAVELAASHLSQEVQHLRQRMQVLREERDALAATSQLLLQERDQAEGEAHTELRRQLEELQALRSDAERRAQEMEARSEELVQRADARAEEQARLRSERELELRRAREELERVEREKGELQQAFEASKNAQQALEKKVQGFDLELARTAQERDAIAEERRARRDQIRNLEQSLLEASRVAADAQREAERLHDTVDQFQTARTEAERALGAALAARHRAEAEVVALRARERLDPAELALRDAEIVRLRRELGRRLAQDRKVETERAALQSELQQVQAALSQTLEQAAGLHGRVQTLEADLERARTVRLRADGEARDLRERLAWTELRLRERETGAEQARQGRRTFEVQASDLQAEVQRLRSALRASEGARAEAEARQRNVEAQAERALAVQRARTQQAREVARSASAELEVRTESLERARVRVEGLEAALAEARRDSGASRAALADAHQAAEVAHAERDGAVEAREAAEAARAEAEDRAQAAWAERDGAVEAREAAEAARAEAEDRLAARSGDDLRARRQSEELDAQRRLVAQLEASQRALREALDAAHTDLGRAVDERARVAARAEAQVREARAEARSREAELEDRLRLLEAAEDRARAQLAESKAMRAEQPETAPIQTGGPRWIERLDAAHAAAADAERRALLLGQRLARAESERDALRAQRSGPRTELSDPRVAALRAEMQSLRARLRQAEETAAGGSSDPAPAGRELAAARERAVTLQGALEEAEARAYIAGSRRPIPKLEGHGSEHPLERDRDRAVQEAEARLAVRELQDELAVTRTLAQVRREGWVRKVEQLRIRVHALETEQQTASVSPERWASDPVEAGADADAELSEAVAALEDAEGRARAAQAHADRLERRVRSLTAELEQVETDSARRQHELEAELERVRAEAAKAAAALPEPDPSLREAESRRSTAERALGEAAERVNLLQRELDRERAEKQALEARAQADARSDEANDARLRRALQEASEARAQVEKLNAKLERTSREEGRVREALERARTQIETLEKERRALATSREEAESRKTQAATELARLRAFNEDLLRTKDELRRRVDDLRQQLQAARSVQKSHEADRSAELRDATRAAESTRAELDQVRERLAQLSAEHQQLERKFAQQTQQSRTLSKQLAEAERTRDELAQQLREARRSDPPKPTLTAVGRPEENAQVVALDEARAEVGRQIASLRAEKQAHAETRAELDRSRGEIERLQSRLAEGRDLEAMREELRQKTLEITRLRTDSHHASAEKERLSRQLEASFNEQRHLERQVVELDAALEEQRRRAEQLRQEVERLRQRDRFGED
jgi:chromosome segregation ATPase